MMLSKAATKQFCNLYEQDRVYSKYIKRYTKFSFPQRSRKKGTNIFIYGHVRKKAEWEMKNFPGERRKDAERNLRTHFVHGNKNGKKYTAKAQLESSFLVLRKKKNSPFLVIIYSIVLWARKEKYSMRKRLLFHFGNFGDLELGSSNSIYSLWYP